MMPNSCTNQLTLPNFYHVNVVFHSSLSSIVYLLVYSISLNLYSLFYLVCEF